MFSHLMSGARWLSREAGFRFLMRRKAACAVAILTMALALGANTAVFSVVRTFLISSIGVPDPDRLFLIAPVRPLPGRGDVVFFDAFPNYQVISGGQHTFDAMACVLQGVASWDDRGETRPLQFARVTASFFATFKVPPALGGAFAPEAEGPSPKPVVVISHALWENGFARDSGIVGKAMRIDGAPYTIVGVMPPGFSQPAPTDIWMPFDILPRLRTAITGGRTLSIFGRLGPGRAPEEANPAVKDFTAKTLAANAVDNRDFTYQARPIRGTLLNGADSTVLLVQGGAVVLLLLAVLNLASLLVAWGFDRRQEMAVRQALGAGTAQVVRMLFMQSAVVVASGAVLGAVAAWLALPWVRGLDINPSLTYFTSRIQLDAGVLALSAAVAAAAALVAGILPAWFNRRVDLSDALRSGSRAVTLSRGALRWQQGMVFVQAALSVVILAAAALVGVSLRNIAKVAAGFDPTDRVVARVQLPDASYGAHGPRATLARALLDNLSREPAIAAFGITSTLPVSDIASGARFSLELSDGSVATEPLLVHYRRVSPDYIAAMKIPLLAGRQLTAFDDSATAPVAIVSRALAERIAPRGNAIGKRIYRTVAGAAPQAVEVVGVVGDVMDAGRTAPPGEAVYLPFGQVSSTRFSIVVEPRSTPAAAIAGVRHALRATDPVLAANSIADLERLTLQANALQRLQTFLLLAFATVAIGIAALGSYGVMSQLVANREREFAVRLVFGAAPKALGGTVFRQIAWLTIPGIAVGIGAVLLLGSVLQRFVFGVDPRSALVLAAVSLGMALIAVAATLPSALRAMRVDIRRSVGAT